ncbi:hypothetical protein ELZ88_23890 (plasmid) [Salmonella enterica subsp. enterica serovar Karamoja]|uniref:Uncharacterized protein n=1 Tax=Salmonella enterica subsp. enterica serovar Karamoja TaxID=2500153 RepID=A0A3Q9MT99_SALET|nr:hypothetical protein ELZ88_23890 [Salmonella enterica subsp. enterica serovar Karamoja]AZT44317.1 hypothetical protein EL007_23945 [Salmonella enterica subsp. enterica serovar Karamoja]
MMQKVIHKTHDQNHARRLTAMTMLHQGDCSIAVAIPMALTTPHLLRWEQFRQDISLLGDNTKLTSVAGFSEIKACYPESETNKAFQRNTKLAM